ncbi:MAG: carboxypeptidase-like regulatory domain-containing protein [Ignavibacteriota bacterium]
MKNIILFLSALSILVFISCRDDDDDMVGTKPGTISGTVMLIDSTGLAFADFSGVTIQLENTAIQTISDVDGGWHLKNVPAGIYTIRASKLGFGNVREFGFQFVGNGELNKNGPYVLGIPPSFGVSLNSVTADKSQVTVSVTANQTFSHSGTWIVLINKGPSIDPLDSSNFVFLNTNLGQLNAGEAYSQSFPTNTLIADKLVSGQTYTAKAFGIGGAYHYPFGSVLYQASEYQNPITKHSIFTATGPGSNTVNFLMP